MVAFAVLFFLLLVSIMTAVAIIVALKAVDFCDATYTFYRRMEELNEKIVHLLQSQGGTKKD
jgi:hypothetical protein